MGIIDGAGKRAIPAASDKANVDTETKKPRKALISVTTVMANDGKRGVTVAPGV